MASSSDYFTAMTGTTQTHPPTASSTTSIPVANLRFADEEQVEDAEDYLTPTTTSHSARPGAANSVNLEEEKSAGCFNCSKKKMKKLKPSDEDEADIGDLPPEAAGLMVTVKKDDKKGHIHSHPFDVNMYATKKSAANGLLDLALLMANASQLKHILVTGDLNHRFYTLMMTLLISSILLQVFVGLALLVLARMRIVHEEDDDHARKANKRADLINNIVVAGIFVLTVINVFISAFGLNENPINYNKNKS